MHMNAHECTQMHTDAFLPIACLFSKNHESTESVLLLNNSVHKMAQQYFGQELDHKVVCLDHTVGLMEGMKVPHRQNLIFAGCWPHLACARCPMLLNAP